MQLDMEDNDYIDVLTHQVICHPVIHLLKTLEISARSLAWNREKHRQRTSKIILTHSGHLPSFYQQSNCSKFAILWHTLWQAPCLNANFLRKSKCPYLKITELSVMQVGGIWCSAAAQIVEPELIIYLATCCSREGACFDWRLYAIRAHVCLCAVSFWEFTEAGYHIVCCNIIPRR